jgi:hypothetical protein
LIVYDGLVEVAATVRDRATVPLQYVVSGEHPENETPLDTYEQPFTTSGSVPVPPELWFHLKFAHPDPLT